jgi:crotonobetainyl-CoA:carnitine CoA-transferase CaiB-like acyl-CoA transferase
MEGPLCRLSRTPAHIRLNAPRFGEHTAWALGHLLGHAEAELDELQRTGITGTTPNMAVHQ